MPASVLFPPIAIGHGKSPHSQNPRMPFWMQQLRSKQFASSGLSGSAVASARALVHALLPCQPTMILWEQTDLLCHIKHNG